MGLNHALVEVDLTGNPCLTLPKVPPSSDPAFDDKKQLQAEVFERTAQLRVARDRNLFIGTVGEVMAGMRHDLNANDKGIGPDLFDIVFGRLEREGGDSASRLTTLLFRGNNLGATGLRPILSAIGSLSIVHLNLSRNNLCDDGAALLKIFVESNETVVTLNLDDNNITNTGAIAIFNALRTNWTLRTLTLSAWSLLELIVVWFAGKGGGSCFVVFFVGTHSAHSYSQGLSSLTFFFFSSCLLIFRVAEWQTAIELGTGRP